MSKQLRSPETIRNYLSHQLADEDLDAFETLLLEDPDFLADVQLEQALREGLNVSAPKVAEKISRGGGLLGKLVDLVMTPVWSFASTAGFAVCLIALYATSTPNTFDGDMADKPAVVGSIVYIENYRSTGLPTYRIDANTSVLLSIDAAEFVGSQVSVTIASSAKQKALSFATKPNANGEVNVVLQPLAAGSYQLTLESGQVSRSFQLKAAI